MHSPLSIREDKKEIYVQGLSEYNVKSVGDTLQLLKIAEDNRAVRETHMNQLSSRSHSIFTINVEYKRVEGGDGGGGEISYRAKFHLVDLAGSEKWDTRKHMGTEHIAEMTNINLSLHTLGKCIAALAKQSRRRAKGGFDSNNNNSTLSASGSLATNTNSNNNIHVPYRESKLTRLLQDSLGGNAKTFLIATISPARFNCEETISTLKFADRAKQVMVQATINESRPVDHAVVQRLHSEVHVLQQLVRDLFVHTGYQPSVRDLVQVACGDRLSLPTPPFGSVKAGSSTHHSVASSTVFSPTQSLNSSQFLHQQPRQNQNHLDVATSMTAFPPSSPNSPHKTTQQSSSNNKQHMGTSTHPTAHNGSEAGDASDFDYIMSLERALNKEQVHAQHLAQKNETLIKELEALKVVNMQLSRPAGHLHNHPPHSTSASTNNNNSAQLDELWTLLPDSSTSVQDLQTAVQDLVQQNDALLTQTETIQKLMKKFFAYQIEEDEMKRDVLQIFEQLKRLKGYVTAQRVNEHFASLSSLHEALQRIKQHPMPSSSSSSAIHQHTHPHNQKLQPLRSPHRHQQQSQSQQQQPNRRTPADVRLDSAYSLPSRSTTADSRDPHPRSAQGGQNRASNGAYYPSQSPRDRTVEYPDEGSHTNGMYSREQYDQIPHQQARQQHQHRYGSDYTSSPLQEHDSSDRSKQRPTMGQKKDSFTFQDFDFQPFNPTGHNDMQSQQQSLNKHSLGKHHSQSHGHLQQQSQQQLQQHRHQQLQPLSSLQPNDDNHHKGNGHNHGSNAISFRVRHQGAPHPHQSQQQQQYVDLTTDMLSTDEATEELMRQEYKRAKARQRKKEQLEKWHREKEERQLAELQQQEEEKKALQEAEREREQKRREYVQKQKARLNNYQDKVKGEAEKIQELLNLGIDPKSLKL